MHVMMLSQTYPSPPYPTLGIFVRSVAAAMREFSTVDVLSPRPYTLPLQLFPYGELATLPMRCSDLGCEVHRPKYIYPIPKKYLYHLAGSSYAASVLRYVKAQDSRIRRPDVIHCHFSYPDGYGGIALRDYFKVPLIVHARGTLERVIAHESPRWRKMIQHSLQSADAVITNSHALTANCEELGVNINRLHCIPDGTDTDLFFPADQSEARQRLGLPDDRPIVLYCGNLRHVKGTHILAQAISMTKNTNARFVLVGSGEMETTVRSQLSSQINTGRVMLMGPRPYEQIPDFMRASDLLVLPSLSEARSNVIPEALACETPVLASEVGGIPEIMEPSHGVLVPPDDPAALSSAWQSLLENPAQLKQMGTAGRNYILSTNLTWKNHAKNTMSLYKMLINNA